MLQPVKVSEFELVVVESADNSRPKNGNNGNYDFVSVYANGILVTQLHNCDWNHISRQYIVNSQDFGAMFYIFNDLVVLSYQDDEETYVLASDGKFYPYNLPE